jgi:RNA polymerase sigma factor (sigma-70 family)
MGRNEGRLGVGHVTAEDLVQIAEKKLVETQRAGEVVLNKQAWVRKVIVREWISILRSPLARGAAKPEELLERPTGDPDPEALLLESESRRRAFLQAHDLIAAAGLTPKETQVVNVYYANDEDTSETARVLGISKGAVRTHLSRALTKLHSAALAGVLATRGHHG